MDGPLVLVAAVLVVRVGRDLVKVNVETAGVKTCLRWSAVVSTSSLGGKHSAAALVPLTTRLEVVEQALNRGERVSTRRPSLSRCGDGEDGDQKQLEESHGRS